MSRLAKWVIVIAAVISLTAVTFFLYAHFLVDYSLENLGLALETTDQNAEETSPVNQHVYRNIVEDLVIDEASQENIDFKSLALLELASRSLDEAIEKAGYSRAKVYLNEVAKTKFSGRFPLLRTTDIAYRFFLRIYQSINSVGTYFRKMLFRPKEEPVEISSLLLLTRAEEKERNWQLDEAADLYRKFLELYPERSEKSYVAIALAQILIRQKKWGQAERVLDQVMRQAGGGKESEIAYNLRKRVTSLRNRVNQVSEIKQLLPAYEGTPLGEKMKFKLALAYLSIGSFTEAQGMLKQLENSKDARLRQKAKFYTGWIYKMQSQYDRGLGMLLNLLDEKEIDRELKLGLEAQLADIYYQKQDDEKSLAHYKVLSEKAREDLLTRKAAVESWIGLAEIEQGVIYYFNVGDRVQARKFLNQAGEFFAVSPKSGILRQKLEDVPHAGLRDLAFRQLRARRVHLALDLFRKNLVRQPKDAWTHSGLATVHILLADLRRGRDYAEKGYHLLKDEYTSSVLAYTMGFLEKYPKAIGYYREAMKVNADYIPARYNLACMYIKTEQYPRALDLLLGLDKTFKDVKNTLRSKTLNNLGFTLWQMGQRKQAVKRFQESLKITPGFMDAKKNLKQVALGQAPQMVNAPQGLNF